MNTPSQTPGSTTAPAAAPAKGPASYTQVKPKDAVITPPATDKGEAITQPASKA